MTRTLTARQRQVLLLAANGNSNAKIAAWRGVTPHSVAEILSAAYRRLGASDRAQAVAIALAVGELGVHEIHVPDVQRETGEAQRAATDGPQDAPEAADGARDVQGAAGAAEGRTGLRGEAAA